MCLSRYYMSLCLVSFLPHSCHEVKCSKIFDKQNKIHFLNISHAQQQAEDTVCLSISHYLIQSLCICSNNWLGSAQNQGINLHVKALHFCFFALDFFLSIISYTFLPYSMCVFMCSLPPTAHTIWHHVTNLVILQSKFHSVCSIWLNTL